MNNKILIIGKGFIGNNLVRFLKEKSFEITVFDSVKDNEFEYVSYYYGNYYEDEIIFDLIKNNDVIIDTISMINPNNQQDIYRESYRIEIERKIRIFDKVEFYNKRYLFLSSAGTVYGDSPSTVFNENAYPRPISHYGCIKLCLENIIHVYNKNHNFIVLRISNPYGPGQDYRRGTGFIDAAIKSVLSNEVLTIWGDGTIIRDYIHIYDVCSIIEKIIAYEGEEEVFNISSGIGYSQNDVIKILESLGYEVALKYKEKRNGDVDKVIVNNTKVNEIFGVFPRSLIDGMIQYMNYLVDGESK